MSQSLNSQALVRHLQNITSGPLTQVQLKSAPVSNEPFFRVLVLGKPSAGRGFIKEILEPWRFEEWAKNPDDSVEVHTEIGPVLVIPIGREPREVQETIGRHWSRIEKSKIVEWHFMGCNRQQWLETWVGLGLASYKYKSTVKENKFARKMYVATRPSPTTLKDIEKSKVMADAVNLARHCVNLPPRDLNPKTYSEFIQKIFAGVANTKVSVWDSKRIEKEKMGMLHAVGIGAEEKSRLVHIAYRPPRAVSKKSTAFVGKGITFDTGGLDLKPSDGMRLMKKDMGGSASVLGIAYWVATTKLQRACDFYFAIAENSVSEKCFHPSDILTARNGKTVEIHNTDAEGRLVLGDALVLACESEPETLIDLATLTGACRVALGKEMAGVFSNNQKTAQKVLKACEYAGEPAWQLPLYRKYKSKLKSQFADMANASDAYAGAITAALFLEEFVDVDNWVHVDMMGWADHSSGIQAEAGGNGQMVQAFAHFLS